ncbi:MAG: PQQ-dependent sugar dehydrogenase [Solirubrobacteraceae bacterium]
MARRIVQLAVLALALVLGATGARAAGPGQVVATGIPYATNVAFDAHGGMWVTSGAPFHQAGDGVWYVAAPGAKPVHVIRGTLLALGLTWFRNRLYVASQLGGRTGIVDRFEGFDGRVFKRHRRVIASMPVWQHPLGSIVPGSHARLYLAVGAEQDANPGGHATSGTIVSFRGDGSDLRIEARGVRGPFGLAFIPGTASLLLGDNGRDDVGAARPPDELNLIRDVTRAAPDFGFPGCNDAGNHVCAQTNRPLSLFRPHSAPGGVAVARNWRGGGLTAFVALNGAVYPGVSAGLRIEQIRLHRRPGGGYDTKKSVLASGFADQDPLGLAIGPDGALYVTLFRTGGVVRFFG